MATLLLSQAGSALGGPVAGMAGALAGSIVDRSVLQRLDGGDRSLRGLAAQSSCYGLPIPRIHGTVRTSGNVIWSTEIRPTGGHKASSGRQTHSVSLAIALSSRPIRAVHRVWADGKLIRDPHGRFAVPVAFRVYPGDERQLPDPFMVAADPGVTMPAYRGLAYVVLEDLHLAEFGNRIPQLAFEVEADAGGTSALAIIDDACGLLGVTVKHRAANIDFAGYVLGDSGSIASNLSGLLALMGADIVNDGPDMAVAGLTAALPGAEPRFIPWRHVVQKSHAAELARPRQRGAVQLTYMDPARDYDFSVQTCVPAGQADTGETTRFTVPGAMTADAARLTAENLAKQGLAHQRTMKLKTTLIGLGLSPGDLLRVEGDDTIYMVRQTALAELVVELHCQPVAAPIGAPATGSAGRAQLNQLAVQQPTELLVLEPPLLPDDDPASPRVLLVPRNSGTRFSGVSIWVSRNGGEDYRQEGSIPALPTTARTLGPLADHGFHRWDETSRLTIRLDDSTRTLESRSKAAVLAGSNLMLVGREVIAFRNARPVAAGDFELSGLLRGLYGSDDATAGHAASEAAVLLDRPAMMTLKVDPSAMFADLLAKAAGPSEPLEAVAATTFRCEGRAIRPVSPVRLQAERLADGAIRLRWTRRSRLGFLWIDRIDAPLAEAAERYEVSVSAAGIVRTFSAEAPELVLSHALQIAQFGTVPTAIEVAVAQVGERAGAGPARRLSVTLA